MIDDAIDSIADFQSNKHSIKSEQKALQNPETVDSDFVANHKSKGWVSIRKNPVDGNTKRFDKA